MTLSDQLESHIADGQTNPPKSGYLGPDWWQLSPEEELVFSIDRVRRWPRMMVAWYFCEIFLGIIDGEEWKISPNIVEAERVRRADIFAQGKSLKGFTEFAAEYAGLTNREAHAAYAKMDFWNVRMGITSYTDER
jgi:hypothetical protein